MQVPTNPYNTPAASSVTTTAKARMPKLSSAPFLDQHNNPHPAQSAGNAAAYGAPTALGGSIPDSYNPLIGG